MSSGADQMFETISMQALLEKVGEMRKQGYRLVQIGATVAIGVLLDTFLVRSVLVPAIALTIGDRFWWPSALSRPGRHPR